MADEGKNVDLRRDRALEALMASPSMRVASERSGIPVRTLWRMVKDPEFKAALREAQREVWGELGRQLLQNGQPAVEALVAIMGDPAAKDAARVSAASKLLDLIFRVIVDTDIMERLEALEAAADTEGQ